MAALAVSESLPSYFDISFDCTKFVLLLGVGQFFSQLERGLECSPRRFS
jgi:hypothetical protein